MKIVQINTVLHGSTGGIMLNISRALLEHGDNAYVCAPDGRHRITSPDVPYIPVGGRLSEDFHIFLGKLTGLQGCFSCIATGKFLRTLDKIRPDLIHLHNLHNSFINLPMLFGYIKKRGIPVVWTLHDCWAFTGHCPYFDCVGCEKWEKQCEKCSQYRQYPDSFCDTSKLLFKKKKEWFTSVDRLTLVTPSEWLGGLVKRSFLKDYETRVINNGVDLSVYKPKESDFRKKYGCEDKFVILGVALGWEARKGLDVFIELSSRLDRKKYKFVLVGVDEITKRQLPDGFVSIDRTQSKDEIAEIYSAADVFLNPTYEDNFPTVNIEALACGTPVITFDTGGSPESIDDTCGVVIDRGDIDGLENAIISISDDMPFSAEKCIVRAMNFSADERYLEYIKLYSDVLNGLR